MSSNQKHKVAISDFKETFYQKYLQCIVLVALFVLCFTILWYIIPALVQNICVIYTVYISIYPLVLTILLIITTLFILRRKNKLKFEYKNICSIIIMGWLLLQFLVVIDIERGYNNVITNYSEEYLSLTGNGVDELNATWSITNSFNNTYTRAYGQGIPIPSRKISNGSLVATVLNPVSELYIKYFEGSSKFTVIQKIGNCGEFASTIKLLVEDVTGFDTRSISMEGVDHAYPEVYINNEWWVFDKVFTTNDTPIKYSDYSSYLAVKKVKVFDNLSNLIDISSGESVLIEHGFNSSELLITTIIDPTSNPADDEPAKNADVEIFAYVNSYDPLVDKGETDDNGEYSTSLRSGKKYLIMVKSGNSVGFKDVELPLNENMSVTIYLHKYE